MIQPVSRICCPFIKEGIHQRMYLLYINKYVTELAGDCRQTSDTKTSWLQRIITGSILYHKLQKGLGFKSLTTKKFEIRNFLNMLYLSALLRKDYQYFYMSIQYSLWTISSAYKSTVQIVPQPSPVTT